MSKILENVPIQMKCAQDKKLELYSKIICPTEEGYKKGGHWKIDQKSYVAKHNSSSY